MNPKWKSGVLFLPPAMSPLRGRDLKFERLLIISPRRDAAWRDVKSTW
jgi:hypothetical protein